jgi:hypothetical protein
MGLFYAINKVFLVIFMPMTTLERIKDIETDFEDLNLGKNKNIKSILNSIIVSISRIKTSDKNLNLALSKICVDIKNLETSEAEFFKLNNSEIKSVEYSPSFFKSLNILKEELFIILAKL